MHLIAIDKESIDLAVPYDTRIDFSKKKLNILKIPGSGQGDKEATERSIEIISLLMGTLETLSRSLKESLEKITIEIKIVAPQKIAFIYYVGNL